MLSRKEEIKQENSASLNRQMEGRISRSKAKSLEDREKSELENQRKSGVNSTKARREIKAKWAQLAEEAMNRVTDKEAPKPPPDFYKAEINNPLPESEQQPATTFENNNPEEVMIPDEAETPTSGGANTGGGLPDGYVEELLDVVNNDNTASQRYFLTRPV